MVYCRGCGKEIHESALQCPHCGAPQHVENTVETSSKSKVTAGLLALFLGGLGVHRFYVGKIGTGIVQALTLGGLGVWALIDLIVIIQGKFTDAKGNLLTQ